MSELKPCPFCGNTPEIVTRDVEPQGDPWYGEKRETFVLCDCGACLFDGDFHEGFYDPETRAVDAWNRRTLLSQLVREELQPAPAAQPVREYKGDGMFVGESVQEAALGWAHWCEVRGSYLLAKFLRVVVAQRGSGESRKPLTDEQVADIVREASRGAATRRDGTTSSRIVRAVETFHGITPQAGKESGDV